MTFARLLRRLLARSRGSAAVEMALVMPLLLVVMMGSVELGNYFLSEHVLVKGVRDGARYAARQAFANYDGCSGAAANVPQTVKDNTKLIVSKGSLNGNDSDLLPNWSNGGTTFTVQMTCTDTADSTTLGGIYTGNLVVGAPNKAPVVIVTASVPYHPVLSSFGFTGIGYSLNATQQASVTGI
jgi:Flp pilus assembly protein TadG